MLYRKCLYKGCGRNKKTCPELSFFRFPVNETDRCIQWLENAAVPERISILFCTETGRAALKNMVLCSLHFSNSCFADPNAIKKKLNRSNDQLRVVPTVITAAAEAAADADESTSGHLNGDSGICDPSSADTSQVLQDETPRDLSDDTPTGLQANTPELQNSTLESEIADDVMLIPDASTPVITKEIIHSPDEEQQLFSADTPKTSKFKNKINNLSKTVKRQRNTIYRQNRATTTKILQRNEIFHQYIANFAPAVKVLIQMQKRHEKKCPYLQEEKDLSLRFFYRSPSFYRAMRADGFKLPCISLIRKWNNVLNLQPGACNNLMSIIADKAKAMRPTQKQCMISFDEMSIKKWLTYNSAQDKVEGYQDLGGERRAPKFATHALVMMARGLQSNWKQPLCYFLSAGPMKATELKNMLISVIKSTLNAGLDVKGIVCDQGTSNQSVFKKLGITTEKTHFQVAGKKIYAFYDVPHIIKSIRNNLVKYNFRDNNGIISWQYIKDLYKLESKNALRNITKLSERHILITCWSKMSVKLAAQVFSRSVWDAMLTAMRLKKKNGFPYLDKKALNTANFVKIINDIFDCLNSRVAYDKNPLCCGLSDFNPQVEAKLREVLAWLPTLKVMSLSTKTPPCLTGLMISIKSTLDLWSDLKKSGTKYLLTSRLNQDPLENLFSILRRRSGFNSNPTASQFRQNLQSVINMTLMKSPASANCEPDSDTSLLSPAEVAAATKITDPDTSTQSEDLITTEYPANEEEDDNEEAEKDAILIQDEELDSETEPDADEEDKADEDVEEDEETDTLLQQQLDEEFLYDYDKENVNTNAPVTIEDTATANVGGYLGMKVEKKFKCKECKLEMVKSGQYLDERDIHILHRDFGVKETEEVKHLNVPTTWWFKITKQMNILVTEFLNKRIHTRAISARLTNHICNLKDVKFWFDSHENCRKHQVYVIELFIRMRLHSTVKRRSTEALVICKKGVKRTYDKNSKQETALKKHRGGNDNLNTNK